MPSALDWLESLSPWPEEFGLGRMHALLTELGEPQRAFPAIHVVGTNGKSTATRRAAAFLGREGVLAGAYTSPHVAGWSERVQVDGEDADLEEALERVRPAAERIGATQFEVLTAAALAEFAEAESRGCGRRGRSRRAAGCDQRPRRAGGRADQRLARPHRRARRDPRGDRGGEAGRGRAGCDGRARRAGMGVARARARGDRRRLCEGRWPRCRRGLSRQAARGRGRDPLARPLRAGGRRRLRGCPQPGRGGLAARAAPAAGLRGGGVDPRRQGRRGDAARRSRLPGAPSSPPPRGTPVRSRPTSSPGAPLRSSRRSSPSPTRGRHSRAHASSRATTAPSS